MKEGNLLEILIFNIFNYLSVRPDAFCVRAFLINDE
jgi:hypothetical protein